MNQELTFELKIDWAQLHEQKRLLLEVLSGDSESALWGIVHLLDALQDQAVDVHGVPEDEVYPGVEA